MRYLAILLIVFLSSCGGSGNDTPVTDNTVPTIPAATSMKWNDSNWNTNEWN